MTAATSTAFGTWAVVQRHSFIPAGTVFMQALPDGAGEVELGWYLHPDSWGRGLASDAAAALLKRGLLSGLDEIWALPAPRKRSLDRGLPTYRDAAARPH